MPQPGDVKTDRFTGKLVTVVEILETSTTDSESAGSEEVKEQLSDDYVRVVAVDGSNVGIGTRHTDDLT